MFKKLLSFEQKFTVTKAAGIVGVFALLSKLVALVRDPLFTSRFGGDNIYILDVYNAAFRVPDFLFNLFIIGTLSVALIPVFVDVLVKDENRAKELANTIITATMLAMSGLFTIVFIFAYQITKLLVPGFSPELLDQTVKLTRIIAISQIIFTLSNICTNLLYSFKRFIMAGIAPTLYNVGIISGILFFYPRFGIIGLGYGVFVGAVLHLLIQLPELARSNFYLRPSFNFSDPALKQFWRLYLPRIFAIDISVFSLLISTFVASSLQTGSIGIFTLSMNLLSLPVSIIALSLATAIFPALSESFARNDEPAFLNLLKKTLIQIFYFMIPIAILMLVFRAQGVRLYLGHGSFSWDNTKLAFSILGILTFSLISQSLTPILARAFYSRQNTSVPVAVNILSMLVNLVLAFILKDYFGILGVAAAFSVASIFNATLLFILFRAKLQKKLADDRALKLFDSDLLSTILKIITASILMGLTCHGGLYLLEPLLNTRTVLGLLIQVTGAFILGLAVFIYSSILLKLKESQIILDYFKKIVGSISPTNKLS